MYRRSHIRLSELTVIRRATESDYDGIADVMYDAVHNGPSAYTAAQRQAWLPARRSGPAWQQRLDSQTVLVAERATELVGFMSLTQAGYIDLAFVRPAAQRTGVFRRMYVELEQLARQAGTERLWVHASLMAQPAFSAMGFLITATEHVEVSGQTLQRYEMEKLLEPPRDDQARPGP